MVSIHAPARGATSWPGRSLKQQQRFNPRAREGRDHIQEHEDKRYQCFNPRAREGRDLPASALTALRTGFNPRAREGRDLRHER